MPMEKNFDPAEAEQRLYAMWEAAGAFKAGASAKPKPDGTPADPFCIMLPPPNVTGTLHMGHAFNHTLMDILVRWHRMRGDDVLWQPGLDHAGIATQMVVERELALSQQPSRLEMGREAFVAKVWDWKAQSGGQIVQQDKRLGASMDWSRMAFTMSGAPGAPKGEEGNFHDAVIKVFVDMYNKGLIYRGKRLVNWDPHFETAISDLEVEQTEVAGHMWHFKYPLAGGETYEYIERDAEGQITLQETRDYIAIATTRPETMLGDGAVAVHPSDARYAPIVGKLCEIPVGPKGQRRLIPIITDEYPDPLFGSGAVKITGAHDFNDYGVWTRNKDKITLYPLMDTKGAMRADDAPDNMVPQKYRGQDRFEARKAVVADITAEGLAVMIPNPAAAVSAAAPAPAPGPQGGTGGPGSSPGLRDEPQDTAAPAAAPGPPPPAMIPYVEAKKIMQPHGDRSKVVIEPMLTDQWFVDTAKIVGPAREAVRSGATKIIPESGEKTYFHWLESIQPWCISRQLWWGHQIPVWYGPTVDDRGVLSILMAPNEIGRQDITIGQRFCAASESATADLARSLYKRDVCFVEPDEMLQALLNVSLGKGPVPLYRDPDVLDTWFSSGLWPIGTLGWPENTPELKKYFPTSTLITGADIIFFWVARMMMMQLAVVNEVPFRTVYLHGLVRDAKGKKMSKSLGNVIDPLEIIDQFGADALRFANAAMASLGGTLKLDTQRIAGYRNFGTKLWSASRFAEMNGVYEGYQPQAAPPKASQTVNRWIIGECAKVLAEVDTALDAYRFNDAADALYKFVWGKVCDWYVEFTKPLLADPATAPETRATIGWVLDQCLILLHPIMPFITEELWSITGSRAKMLIHADWPTYGADRIDAAADREMTWVIALIDEIRSARAEMRVPVGLKLPMVQVELDASGKAAWARNAGLIQRLARIDSLTEGAAPKGSLQIVVAGGSFALPLDGVIDIEAEKTRLTKSLEKLEKDMGGLQGRLNNPRFVASAAEEVVEETRDNLALGEAEAAKLRQALARLAEMV